MAQLSQKETDLLKDLKSSEELCIEKYQKHSGAACDSQLKNLFSQLSQAEQKHLQTLQEIEAGQTPSQQQGGSQSMPTFSETYSTADSQDKQNQCYQNDSYLCSDVLSAEKHVSHLYDTCIFEFSDESLRNTLAQIQKQEQNHGKMIYDYMSANHMYA